ncbi:RidA family protein [Rhodobacteraceae bacterium]|nr:RidA family protein [Paracoccaceae bacterium]
MSTSITEKLQERGLVLPSGAAPAANYVPFVHAGSLLFVSGQISMDASGGLITGKLGAELDVEQGAAAAERCALGLLAQVSAACGGDLGKLKRVVKLTGFVNSTPEFTDQPKVINGASDLLVELLGDAGRHSRSAVSAGALPFNVAVEVEGIFELA